MSSMLSSDHMLSMMCLCKYQSEFTLISVAVYDVK